MEGFSTIYHRLLRALVQGSFLAALAMLTGCVGTLQQTAQEYADVFIPGDKVPTFSGVYQVVPISDTKLEIFFYPASGGSGKYTYDVLVGNSPFPISYPSDVLAPDYRGLLRVTIKNLTRLTSYQIKVEVRDGTSAVQSNSQNVKTVSTFDNQVGDFDGITGAFNMPGQDGKDSIKIRWTPARGSGGIVKQTWDPKSYEVVVVDAGKLSPNDMDTNFTAAQGRYVYSFNHSDTTNEYVVRGLPSNKRFYVRMRVLHEGSEDNVYNPRIRSELNTKYVEISTLSNSLADLKFEPQSYAVALAPGDQGLSAFLATWTQAFGVFDHYRLFYSVQGGGVGAGTLPALCLNPATSPSNATVFCKKIDLTAAAGTITGLKPYTTYETVLVLCQTSNCSVTERIVSPPRVVTTDPQFPAFTGVQSVAKATSLQEMGTLTVNYEPPSFSVGYFDGLVLRMRRTVEGTDAEITLDSDVSKPVYFNAFEYASSASITVNGINYLSDQPYCFSLSPYKFDSDGVTKREVTNSVWKCIQPSITPPTVLEFPGLRDASTSYSGVTLNWEAPTNGIFAYYEVYYRKRSSVFNWGDALAQAGNGNFANYGRVLVDGDRLTTTIALLEDGDYAFGVITYYSYVTEDGTTRIRSETNNTIFRCSVNGENDNIVLCSL